MATLYRQPRGTRAALDALAASTALSSGQVYLLTDEDRLAVATAANAYADVAKLSDITNGINQSNPAGSNIFEGTFEARNGATFKGAKQIGTPGDFTSILTNTDVDLSFTVNGGDLFATHRGINLGGELNVVDNGGIQTTGVYNFSDVRVRVANPEYAEVFGMISRVARNVKDGTDIGNQNIWLVGAQFAVQQDAESTSRSEEMTPVSTVQKIENGICGYSAALNAQAQIGNASGRNVTVDTLVQTVGSSSYFIGLAGNTTTIGTFVQLDLPKPTYAGTVNITNRYGVRQMDDTATNVFKGVINADGGIAASGLLTLDGSPVLSDSDIASNAQALAGTDNSTVMTPLRTAEAIAALAPLANGQAWKKFATHSTASGSSVTVPLPSSRQVMITFEDVSQAVSGRPTWTPQSGGSPDVIDLIQFESGGSSNEASAQSSCLIGGVNSTAAINGTLHLFNPRDAGERTLFDSVSSSGNSTARRSGFIAASDVNELSIAASSGSFDGGQIVVWHVDEPVGSGTKGFSTFCSGTPGDAEVIGGGLAPYDITLSQANSQAKALVAATASTTLSIKNDGVEIGTIVFAAAATVGTVTITTPAALAGDHLTIHAPATADATLADIAILLRS